MLSRRARPFAAAVTIPIGVTSPTTSTRSEDLDAARGAAMVFVCLSHFTSAFFPSMELPGPQQWLAIVTMVASPTFVMLSGVLLGWRYRTAPERFPRFRSHLLDRALFLLTIGHLAIEASQLRRMAVGGENPMFVVLTDVIAIALIVGPIVVAQLGVRARLVVAVALYMFAWSLILFWTPDHQLGRVVKAMLFGLRSSEGDIGGYCVPVVPWLAVYIAATCMGHALAGRATKAGLLDCPLLWRLGLAGVSIALLQRLVVLDVLGHRGGEWVMMLSALWQKVPPGPAYLVFYGGAGLMMVAFVAQLRQLVAGQVATRWLELVGRNSAIVFIAQFYVYSILVPMVRPWAAVSWPLVFVPTALLLVLFAWWWERERLGRLLTVQPILGAFPTPSMRTAFAVGLAAVVLVLSAHADALVRPPARTLHAAAMSLEATRRHL